MHMRRAVAVFILYKPIDLPLVSQYLHSFVSITKIQKLSIIVLVERVLWQ